MKFKHLDILIFVLVVMLSALLYAVAAYGGVITLTEAFVIHSICCIAGILMHRERCRVYGDAMADKILTYANKRLSTINKMHSKAYNLGYYAMLMDIERVIKKEGRL